jgi:hypothetical protein
LLGVTHFVSTAKLIPALVVTEIAFQLSSVTFLGLFLGTILLESSWLRKESNADLYFRGG